MPSTSEEYPLPLIESIDSNEFDKSDSNGSFTFDKSTKRDESYARTSSAKTTSPSTAESTENQSTSTSAKDTKNQTFWSKPYSSFCDLFGPSKRAREQAIEIEEKKKRDEESEKRPTSRAKYSKSASQGTIRSLYTEATKQAAESIASYIVYRVASAESQSFLKQSDYCSEAGPRQEILTVAGRLEKQAGLLDAIESTMDTLSGHAREFDLDEKETLELGLKSLTTGYVTPYGRPNPRGNYAEVVSGMEWSKDTAQRIPDLAAITSRKSRGAFEYDFRSACTGNSIKTR